MWSRPQEASKDESMGGQFDENLYFYAYFNLGGQHSTKVVNALLTQRPRARIPCLLEPI